jgi:hypothetical protein
MPDVRGIIDTANQTFKATVEQWRRLAATKIVNRADLRKYVVQVLDLTEDDKGQLTTRSANTLAAVLENAVAGKGNANPAIVGTWWAALNGVTEYLAYNRGRTDDTRLNSLWFGDSAAVNQRALETAIAMAT